MTLARNPPGEVTLSRLGPATDLVELVRFISDWEEEDFTESRRFSSDLDEDFLTLSPFELSDLEEDFFSFFSPLVWRGTEERR